MRVESAGCESSPFGRQVGYRGCLDAYPAHIRLVQPSVRTAGSKPAILEVPVRVGRTRKENSTTYSRHRKTRGTVGSVAQNMIKTSRKTRG